MTRILQMHDRIKLKIDDLEFTLAPLNYFRKQELASCTKVIKGEEHFDLVKAKFLYIKYSLKSVSGLKGYDDIEFELEFESEANDALTDDCVSSLFNIEQNDKLTIAAWRLLNGIKDFSEDEYLKGVELEVMPGGKSIAPKE